MRRRYIYFLLLYRKKLQKDRLTADVPISVDPPSPMYALVRFWHDFPMTPSSVLISGKYISHAAVSI